MEQDYSELIEYLDQKFENIDKQFKRIDGQFQNVDNQFSQLPTKSYLDDKLVDLEGDWMKKLRKEDEKVNRLAELLKQKKILTDSELSELANLKVFPK